MKQFSTILFIILIFFLIGSGIASAAEYPAAPLGTTDSMAQFVNWLCELVKELIEIFTSAMDLIGLSNESYVKDMLTTLEDGMELVNTT